MLAEWLFGDEGRWVGLRGEAGDSYSIEWLCGMVGWRMLVKSGCQGYHFYMLFR